MRKNTRDLSDCLAGPDEDLRDGHAKGMDSPGDGEARRTERVSGRLWL